MKPVAESADSLLGLARRNDGRMLLLIRDLFASAAGPAADRIQPQSFQQGELILIAAEERWLSVGRESVDDLRAKLNRMLGREIVRRIIIRLGELPRQKHSVAQPKRVVKKASPPREVAETAAIIGDERAREAFLALAASVTALRGTDEERK